MRKEILEMFYKNKFEVQDKIEKLKKLKGQPIPSECSDCPNAIQKALDIYNDQLAHIDHIIDFYIKIHTT